MKKWMAVLIAATMLTCGLLTAQQGRAFRLVFSRADVSDVLRSISLQTGARIIFSVPPDARGTRLVTVDVTVNSAEEAIRATVSSSGLTFRKVGNTFVVAEEANMKTALAPYAVQARYALTQMTAEEAATFLEKAIPTVTARVAGTRVLVIGIPEDQLLARELLAEREAQLRDTEVVSRMVNLKYAASDQAARMLTTLFPSIKVTPSGTPNQAGGSLAISGPKDDVQEAIRTLEELDVPVVIPAPDLSYKIYDVKYASANVLKSFVEESFADVKVFVAPESYTPPQPEFNPLSGTIRSSQGTLQGGGGGGGTAGGPASGGSTETAGARAGSLQPYQVGKAGDRAKKIILRGPALLVDSAIALLSEVDVKPLQVQVEIKVIDVSPEKLREAGFDYNWSPLSGVEFAPGTQLDGWQVPIPPAFDYTGPTRNLGFGAFSRIPWQIEAILQGLVTKREAKILANPNVVVVDNDDANIFIGDTIRVQLTSASGLGGTTSQIAEFPVGILMLIRPRINADGNVTMRVHPIVSAVTGINDDLPQTSTREAETTVIVKDGETIVIGGLIREDMTRTTREIPILADIPLLGELFRSRTTNHRRSDILLFITTRIVKDGEQPAKPGQVGRKGE